MAAFRAAFIAFKNKRPLAFNCLTYGTLYMGAEFSQQSMLRKVLPEKKEDYDFKLISRYGVLGTAVFPPILFYWYKWLDGRFVGTAVKTIATKVVLDQAVSAPIILGLFYIGMSLMEGRPDIFQELREKFVDTFKKCVMFWGPMMFANFRLVPSTGRVAFVAFANLIWVNILCMCKRTSKQTEKFLKIEA